MRFIKGTALLFVTLLVVSCNQPEVETKTAKPEEKKSTMAKEFWQDRGWQSGRSLYADECEWHDGQDYELRGDRDIDRCAGSNGQKKADVVLGFNTLDEYLKGHPFFGAIAGRYANRIGKGYSQGEFLRPVDSFSVVAYASRSQLLVPPTLGKDRQKLQQIAHELEYLKLGDETHVAEGLALALRELRPEAGNHFAPRLIVLTDGYTRNVKECFELAREARKSGTKITTMGIGVDFNEELLISLADLTGGNAYYVETPERIPDALRQELGSALSISYRNVEVKVLLAQVDRGRADDLVVDALFDDMS